MSHTQPVLSPYDPENRSATSTPPPGSGTNSPNAGVASYLPSALSLTVSSIFRRINTPPTTAAVSSHSPTPMKSSYSTVSEHAWNAPTSYPAPPLYPPLPGALYTPPSLYRHPSPFQPPPLSPLILSGFLPDTALSSRILTRSLAEEIRLLIPPRLQLQDTWTLAYSLDQDGVSLKTLYSGCAQMAEERHRGGWVLVVRDRAGIFGAYLTDYPRISRGYYGTGECFLWKVSVVGRMRTGGTPTEEEILLAGLPPPPSADTTNMGRSTTLRSGSPTPTGNEVGRRNNISTSIRFKAFPYSGVNNYFILCDQHF